VATDDALLAKAIGLPGKGALCKGEVFQAEKAVTVYRVFGIRANPIRCMAAGGRLSLPKGPTRINIASSNDIRPGMEPL